jgi:hypothetical protein
MFWKVPSGPACGDEAGGAEVAVPAQPPASNAVEQAQADSQRLRRKGWGGSEGVMGAQRKRKRLAAGPREKKP